MELFVRLTCLWSFPFCAGMTELGGLTVLVAFAVLAVFAGMRVGDVQAG